MGESVSWWRETVGYEIYLRSFADSSGDGIGDLPGVLDRLDYLDWLGVNLLWITPFYPSPMHDHGYDVADHTAVDPMFGEIGDVDRLVAAAHQRGMRVIIDLVPNHTSSEHRWFREARSSRDNPYRDYYIWRDPAPDGGPPNNWVSHFGGPAWTFDEATGQYWCHLFLPEQPDLNWANPQVMDEFDEILRFWLERGVDGFRIDVAHALAKHPNLPDLPVAARAGGTAAPTSAHERLEHRFDVDQPEVTEIYRRWRRVAEPYGGLLLGEVYLLDAERVARYVRDQDGLHLAFWFKPLHIGWDPAEIRSVLDAALRTTPDCLSWVQASHDRPRPVTRFGGGDLGRKRALALATVFFGLPGVPFLYQGEELGLTDGRIAPADAQDPIAVREGELDRSRDGARTPMPWKPDTGLGFTRADRPWLPFGGRMPQDTVAVQREDPDSWLHRYRRLIEVRGALPELRHAPLDWVLSDGPVLAYERGGDVIVAANCGDEPAAVPTPGRWSVLFATERSRQHEQVAERAELAPLEAVILRRVGRAVSG